METSLYQELVSQLEQCKTWFANCAFVNVYVVNESGEEEKQYINICLHIHADSNGAKEKSSHQSNFQSHSKRGRLEKIYLSDAFNAFHEKGC
jgi:hypothetical protein